MGVTSSNLAQNGTVLWPMCAAVTLPYSLAQHIPRRSIIYHQCEQQPSV